MIGKATLEDFPKAKHAVNHEQSGVYAVIKNKIDKSKSFAFISEHSIFFYLKLEQMSATVLGNLRSNRDTNCGTEGWLMLQTEIFGRQLNAHLVWNH